MPSPPMLPPQPGPNTAPQQAPQALTDSTIQRPMAPEQVAQWREAIEQSRAVRAKVATWWDANLKAYAPQMDTNPDVYGDELNTNRDFTLVERKKADLFYQRPDVSAVASPRLKGHETLIETHTHILNEKLGPDGVDAESLVDVVLFDVLCPAGMGWSVMGYESATVDTPQEVQDPQAMPQGAVLGLRPQTKTVMVPVPIYEDCFWNALSPKCGLVPADAKSVDSDTWPWIGMEIEIPLRTAKRKKWVGEDEEGTTTDPDLRFDHGLGAPQGDKVVRGVLIYYKSSLYRDDRVHPLHQTRLILIDGHKEPADHVDSPYQTLDAQSRLTPDSLIGYPIHPCTIRTLSDSAYVPSDCTISRPTVNELNKFRTQIVEMRNAQLLAYYYNVDTLPTDALQKAVDARIGSFVGMPAEAFIGEGAIKEFPHGQYPRENFEFTDQLDNDLARTHAIDAEQSGAGQRGEQSATESMIKQNNVNARLGRERGRVLSWYLRGVTKYSAILQRLLPVEDAAAIVGEQKAQEWDGWRHTVPASLAFTALPDSTLRNDRAVDRKRKMDEFSFLVNAQGINKLELLKELLPTIGLPMSVLDLQPPQPHPEPTRPTFAFKGEDLNPLAPQFAIVMEVLRQSGVNVSQQAVQEAQGAAVNALVAPQPANDAGQGTAAPPEHGGKLPQMENLSKHAAALTGGMQGSGQLAPMQPGSVQ